MVTTVQRSLDGANILMAEDDDEFRRLLIENFEQQGCQVTAVRNGLDLVGQLRCLEALSCPEDFDLIISDIRMPGVTGLSVLEGLQSFPEVPPVVLITAFGDESTHAEAKRMGAVAVIDKPFTMRDLISTAERCVAVH